MKIVYVYEKGVGRENEDGFVIIPDQKTFAVIDGATGLNPLGLTGKFASSFLEQKLKEYASDSKNLKEIMNEINVAYRTYIQEVTGKDLLDIEKHDRSTCGFMYHLMR